MRSSLASKTLFDTLSSRVIENTKRRNEIAAEKTAMLGSRWIMMPNPVYGSWQRALPKSEKALWPKLEKPKSVEVESTSDAVKPKGDD